MLVTVAAAAAAAPTPISLLSAANKIDRNGETYAASDKEAPMTGTRVFKKRAVFV